MFTMDNPIGSGSILSYPKGTPIEVTIDPPKPERSIVAFWEI
jgi:hypothetical protein